jgi:ABC-2 type transport system ATP-binding protein/ribosome-dependent ATPase
MSSLITADALTMRFGQLTAVDDVSFAVGPGEVVGLLGANGAGKTTTLRMLLGLLRPTSGSALLGGGRPTRERRKNLGYVPQGLGLYEELTVQENLEFAAQAFGSAPAALTGPLDDARDRQVRDLPLGLARRLAFLCAVQHGPTALVLDEPTSGVDPLARSRLWDEVRAQSDRGVGVLVTTHYMQEARQCDRLLLMADGRLVAEGTEADIVDGTSVLSVTGTDWAGAFEVLTGAGFTVNLDGTGVRVVDADEQALRRALEAGGMAADLVRVTPTIEERMAAISAAAQ